MSRFGIRNRLKERLGLGKPERSIVLHTVTYVLPDGTEQQVQAEEHYSLLMASQSLPSPISTGRRAGGTCPDGKCASCRVEVLDSTGLTEMSAAERSSLEASIRGDAHEGRERTPAPPLTPNTRLACHTKIMAGGARVQVAELFDYDTIRGDPDGG
jgi:ferredoxin